MDAGTFIGLLLGGMIVTFFMILMGVQIGQTNKEYDKKELHFMMPIWLFLGIGVVVISLSIFFYKGFWLALGIWIVGGLGLGASIEALTWKITPKEKISEWIKNTEEKVRKHEEAKQKALDELQAKAKEGIFKVKVTGEKIPLGDYFCYLQWDPGLRVPGYEGMILVNENGIDFGKLRCYHSKHAANAAVGGITPLGMVTFTATGKETQISIPWKDFDKCVCNSINGHEYFIFTYVHAAKDRKEWLAINLFFPENKQIFRDTLNRYGMTVIETSEPLLKY